MNNPRNFHFPRFETVKVPPSANLRLNSTKIPLEANHVLPKQIQTKTLNVDRWPTSFSCREIKTQIQRNVVFISPFPCNKLIETTRRLSNAVDDQHSSPNSIYALGEEAYSICKYFAAVTFPLSQVSLLLCSKINKKWPLFVLASSSSSTSFSFRASQSLRGDRQRLQRPWPAIAWRSIKA